MFSIQHRQEMEKHKQLLDKEYEQLLTQFSKVDKINLDQQIYFSIIIYNQGRKYQRGVKLFGSTQMIYEQLCLSPEQWSDSFCLSGVGEDAAETPGGVGQEVEDEHQHREEIDQGGLTGKTFT